MDLRLLLRALGMGIGVAAGPVALGIFLFFRTEDPVVLPLLFMLGLVAGLVAAAVVLSRGGFLRRLVTVRCRECRTLNAETQSHCGGCGAAI